MFIGSKASLLLVRCIRPLRSTAGCVQKEERELERLREQERVRAGKELLAAKKLEDDLRLKRNLEERRREKEEEARAKERIRLKLGRVPSDRRQSHLGNCFDAALTLYATDRMGTYRQF